MDELPTKPPTRFGLMNRTAVLGMVLVTILAAIGFAVWAKIQDGHTPAVSLEKSSATSTNR